MFPMAVRKVSATHSGPTKKEYHLVLITTPDGRGVVINRWGKARTWGSLTVTTFDKVAEAIRAFNAKLDEKMGGEYRENRIDTGSKIVNDLPELTTLLGNYWPEFGKKNATWLIPGVDTTHIREPKEKKFKDLGNGRMTAVTDPPRLVEEEPVVIDPAAEARKNPNWGLF